MKVIVLAAGEGQRFKNTGFTIDKPLIHLQNTPLISYALHQLIPEDTIVVGTPSVCKFVQEEFQGMIASVEVSVLQPGPAVSALYAGSHLDFEDGPIIVMDSDSLFEGLPYIIKDIRKAFRTEHTEAVIVGTDVGGLDPSEFCTIHASNGSRIIALREKETNEFPLVGVGIYAFKNWATYLRLFSGLSNKVCCPEEDRKGELYMSEMIKKEAEDNKFGVAVVTIQRTSWRPVGTPKQYVEAMSELLGA